MPTTSVEQSVFTAGAAGSVVSQNTNLDKWSITHLKILIHTTVGL